MMWNCRIIVWLIVVNYYYWFRIELWLVRMLVINRRFLGWLVLGIRHWPSGGRLVAGTMVVVRRRRLRVGLRHLLRLIGGRILGDRFTRHVTGHFMLLIVLIFIFINGRLEEEGGR